MASSAYNFLLGNEGLLDAIVDFDWRDFRHRMRGSTTKSKNTGERGSPKKVPRRISRIVRVWP